MAQQLVEVSVLGADSAQERHDRIPGAGLENEVYLNIVPLVVEGVLAARAVRIGKVGLNGIQIIGATQGTSSERWSLLGILKGPNACGGKKGFYLVSLR